jgi:glycosyltransferase involved in cell wall biosynthesis
MAPYLKVVRRAGGARVVLGFDNVGTYQYSRISRIASTRLERTRAWVHSRMLRCWEPRFAEHFDRCIVVSEIDRKLLLEANPNLEIDVVPNGVDTEIYRAMPYGVSARALLFIGNMAYAPCADGALWFCNEILPRIRKVVPGVEVWIVGNSPPREVAQLEGEGVHVTGRVGSVQAYYEASAVSVVPIRAGGGTRLKILESMALGRPVVSTTVGCEGIDVEPGKHLLIGDTAERFADQVLLLLSERDLWEGISRRGREFVVREHDWNLIGNRLLEVYAEVAGSRGAWGFEKTQRGMGLEKCM